MKNWKVSMIISNDADDESKCKKVIKHGQSNNDWIKERNYLEEKNMKEIKFDLDQATSFFEGTLTITFEPLDEIQFEANLLNYFSILKFKPPDDASHPAEINITSNLQSIETIRVRG